MEQMLNNANVIEDFGMDDQALDAPVPSKEAALPTADGFPILVESNVPHEGVWDRHTGQEIKADPSNSSDQDGLWIPESMAEMYKRPKAAGQKGSVIDDQQYKSNDCSCSGNAVMKIFGNSISRTWRLEEARKAGKSSEDVAAVDADVSRQLETFLACNNIEALVECAASLGISENLPAFMITPPWYLVDSEHHCQFMQETLDCIMRWYATSFLSLSQKEQSKYFTLTVGRLLRYDRIWTFFWFYIVSITAKYALDAFSDGYYVARRTQEAICSNPAAGIIGDENTMATVKSLYEKILTRIAVFEQQMIVIEAGLTGRLDDVLLVGTALRHWVAARMLELTGHNDTLAKSLKAIQMARKEDAFFIDAINSIKRRNHLSGGAVQIYTGDTRLQSKNSSDTCTVSAKSLTDHNPLANSKDGAKSQSDDDFLFDEDGYMRSGPGID